MKAFDVSDILDENGNIVSENEIFSLACMYGSLWLMYCYGYLIIKKYPHQMRIDIKQNHYNQTNKIIYVKNQ